MKTLGVIVRAANGSFNYPAGALRSFPGPGVVPLPEKSYGEASAGAGAAVSEGSVLPSITRRSR
jgi:hypothetical protein